MIKVTNIKYIYTDSKYQIECVDFIGQLQVENTDYESVLTAVKQCQKSAQDIKVLSYTANDNK